MRSRTLIASTALHAGLICGLGVWIGVDASAAPRRPLKLAFQLDPLRAAYIVESNPGDVSIDEESVEPEAHVVEPILPPPDTSVFEVPEPDDVEPLDDPRPTIDPWIRVRPPAVVETTIPDQRSLERTPAEPVTEPATAPPAPPVWVEAKVLEGHNREPEYPRRSVERGEEGEVTLRLSIDARGAVIAVAVDRASGFRRLDRAASAAAWKWRFEPARRDGVAVAATKLIPVEFRIVDQAK